MLQYKNHEIVPQVVCFDMRYFVSGEGFFFESFESIERAKREIDKWIAKKFIKDILNNIESQIEVDKDIIVECVKELVLND